MNLFLKRLGGFYKYRFLMQQLVTKDIKLKYRRSFLGYLWSILNPLMVMVIMVIVFSNMFRSDIVNFPVYLIIGQTLYNFMSESTTQAIFSIIGNASLLKKTYVPKYVFTVSKITSSFVNMVFALGALVIVFVVCRGRSECFLSIYSGNSSAGISVLPGTGNALGAGVCILPRYTAYL